MELAGVFYFIRDPMDEPQSSRATEVETEWVMLTRQPTRAWGPHDGFIAHARPALCLGISVVPLGLTLRDRARLGHPVLIDN